MKRCPECRRDYYDDTLLYCLEDGSSLVQGSVPSPDSEPVTAILSVPPAVAGRGDSDDAVTRHQAHITDQTAVLPRGVDAGPSGGLGVVDFRGATVKRRFANNRAAKLLAAVFLVLILVGGFFGYRYFSNTGSKQINSIAVMPFENRNSDADTDYLSDGLAESVIFRLTQIPDLRVSPTSSVMRYKGKETDVAKIASELGVDAVMTGRLTKRGDNLNITVELVDARTNKSLWGEQYERKLSELLTTQREIVAEIVGKLQLKLSGESEQKLAKKYTDNNEAYQLYLIGNFYRTKFTEESYKKGIGYYEKAIALDPNFALAYYGIAASYDFANGFYLSPKEAAPKAKAAALKALELDETLAETHYLLGKTLFWYEWDWTAAEKEWNRASQLDSSYPAYYPPYLSAMGRHEEAVKAQETELRRLPLDLNMNMDAASLYLAAGRYDQAIEQTRKALELDPNFWWSHQVLGLAYERKKQYREAISALEKARLLDVNPTSLGYLGYVSAVAGKGDEARKILEELKELSKKRYVDPYNIACVYAGLNDRDQAFEWLERAYQERSFCMALLKTETVLDNLRPDPRFKDLLKRMNLPE
jgi:adenylate cyclase